MLKLAQQLLTTGPASSRHSVTIKHYPQSLLKYAWKWGGLGVAAQLPHIDVFHSWDWLQPPDKKLPLVSTVHDLAILKYPQTAHPEILSMHQQSWAVLKKRQARIIAVSQTTKRDIVELLGYPPYLVHVIHEALPVEFSRIDEQMTEDVFEQIKTQLKLEKPYILFVGTREPRKNLARLIEAWQPLAADYELVIAGAAGWDETSAEKKYNNLPIRFLGHVTDSELSVLYAQAAVFAYPSLDEGFGLPILEAFHHGTPVVTSKTGGTLEVAGNAAELVDPKSVDELRAGLVTVLNEPLEAQRKRLQRMVVRLHMFNWQKVAQETLAVYQKAIQDAQDGR